jgi:V8-like Glu-specific endopeptidase
MWTKGRVLVATALSALAATTVVATATHQNTVPGVATAQSFTVERVSVDPQADKPKKFDGDGSEAPTLDELLPTRNVPIPENVGRRARNTVGKIYATWRDGRQWWGTATVVKSKSQDMLLTAGHLVIDDHGTPSASISFVPGASGDSRPNGVWKVRGIAVPSSFDGVLEPYKHQRQDDLAFVMLMPRGDQHIGNVVGGGQPICFDCPRTGRVHVYGYPDNHQEGSELDTHCQVYADFRDLTKPFGLCLEGNPVLTNGVSGGPVFTNFDPVTGDWPITAIETWGPEENDPNAAPDNGGVYLSSLAKRMYDLYENK